MLYKTHTSQKRNVLHDYIIYFLEKSSSTDMDGQCVHTFLEKCVYVCCCISFISRSYRKTCLYSRNPCKQFSGTVPQRHIWCQCHGKSTPAWDMHMDVPAVLYSAMQHTCMGYAQSQIWELSGDVYQYSTTAINHHGVWPKHISLRFRIDN